MKPSKSIKPASKKRPAPLSVRLSDEQRNQLKQMSGNMTVNAYIVMRLFGEDAPKKRARRITQDILLLSQILAKLGQSGLHSDLSTLAEAAKGGALHVSPEVEEQLVVACSNVTSMKSMLMQSIGIQED